MHIGAAPAEAMNSGFEELLSIFNENGVRYLILGGLCGAGYHPAPQVNTFSRSTYENSLECGCYRVMRAALGHSERR